MAAFFVKGEKITLKSDGTWIADGIEITHDQTRELFYRSIKWDASEKKYYLEVGYERMFIEVEDTPCFVTAVSGKDDGETRAVLSDGRELRLDAPKLSYQKGRLYLDVGDGFRARFLSAPFYELLKGLSEDEQHYYLVVNGRRVDLADKAARRA